MIDKLEDKLQAREITAYRKRMAWRGNFDHLTEKQRVVKQLNRSFARKCEICAAPIKGKQINVDHCHKTQAVRGFLCFRCNSGLGMFGDSTFIMGRAIAYLAKYLKA